MIHPLFSQSFYRLKTDRSLYVIFQSVQFFFASSSAKFHVKISGWTEVFMERHRDYFVLHSDQISLKFLLQFSFDKLIFVAKYNFAVVKILSKLHEREFL